MTEDEGFLQRWSRRKHSVLRDEQTPESEESEAPGVDDQGHTPSEAVPAQQASDDLKSSTRSEAESEPPGDEDMPPLESIDEGGSITAFFSPRVSEGLRRAALRRLFRQPKYNVVDMLDDYAEDYSKPAALGSIVTADMRYRAEQAAKRMERKLKEAMADQDNKVDSVTATETGPDTDLHTQPPAEEVPGTDDQALADAGDPPETADERDDDPDRQPG